MCSNGHFQHKLTISLIPLCRFGLFVDTPRPSHNLAAISAKLVAFAKQYNLEHRIDKEGNIVICRPASNSSFTRTIALQSHIDMVCSQTADSKHDFNQDPIAISLGADGFLRANGTTLGADDGIGAAAALALLSAGDELELPAIEALFTVDEETTMGGAENLAPAPFLTADILVNLDSEQPSEICIGCAGGVEKKIVTAIERNAPLHQNFAWTQFEISGLMGGHSGINIGDERANAIRVVSRMISEAKQALSGQSIDIYLGSISGGNAPNAIPRSAQAAICTSSNAIDAERQLELVRHHLMESFEHQRAEFALNERPTGTAHEESKVTWKLDIQRDVQGDRIAMDAASTNAVLDLIAVSPHGVIRHIAGLEPPQVESSISMSIVSTDSQCVTLHFFARSSVERQLDLVMRHLDSLARLHPKMTATPEFNRFPAWQPNVLSPALKLVIESHQDLFGFPCRVYSIHAGLECGLIQGKYPRMDMVSIGPLILDAHSPDERLDVKTVEPFYNWLVAIVQRLGKIPQ